MSKLIFLKKPSLVDTAVFVVTILLVSLTIVDRLGKYSFLPLLTAVVVDAVVSYLYVSRALRQIYFFDDKIVLRYPIRRLEKTIFYSDIKNVNHKYVPGSGNKLFIYYADETNSRRRIGFEYYPKEDDLIGFLKSKGISVAG